jgi:hypothetical protein
MAALARRSILIWHLSFTGAWNLYDAANASAQNGIDEKDSNENRISAAFSVEINSGIDDGLSSARGETCEQSLHDRP